MKFVHVYSRYPAASAEEARRNDFAQSTWARLPNLIPCAVPDDSLELVNFAGKRLPSIKAIIQCALEQHPDRDYFCFSNNDICFVKQYFTERVEHYFKLRPLERRAFSYSARLIPPPVTWPLTTPQILDFPFRQNGHDIFFFSRQWWTAIAPGFPHFVVGHSKWDNCLYFLVCAHGRPVAVQRRLLENGIARFWEYNSSRFCYTEDHVSFWKTAEGNRSDREAYNVALCDQFFAALNARLYGDSRGLAS